MHTIRFIFSSSFLRMKESERVEDVDGESEQDRERTRNDCQNAAISAAIYTCTSCYTCSIEPTWVLQKCTFCLHNAWILFLKFIVVPFRNGHFQKAKKKKTNSNTFQPLLHNFQLTKMRRNGFDFKLLPTCEFVFDSSLILSVSIFIIFLLLFLASSFVLLL